MSGMSDEIEKVVEPEDKETERPFQFSLRSLMLLITLIAVCLGVGRLLPRLGILLFLTFVPAYLRTVWAEQLRFQQNSQMKFFEACRTLFVSIGIFIVIGTAAAFTFMASLLVSYFLILSLGNLLDIGVGPHGGSVIFTISVFIVPNLMGLIASTWISLLLFKLLWPIEKKDKSVSTIGKAEGFLLVFFLLGIIGLIIDAILSEGPLNRLVRTIEMI